MSLTWFLAPPKVRPASDVMTTQAFVGRCRWIGPGPSGPTRRERTTKNLTRGDQSERTRYIEWLFETSRRSAGMSRGQADWARSPGRPPAAPAAAKAWGRRHGMTVANTVRAVP